MYVLDILPILHISYDNPNLLNETNSKQYAAFLKLNLEQWLSWENIVTVLVHINLPLQVILVW